MIGLGQLIREGAVQTSAKLLSGRLSRRGSGGDQEGYGVEVKRHGKSGSGDKIDGCGLISDLKVLEEGPVLSPHVNLPVRA
jgi:hypothetical protein